MENPIFIEPKKSALRRLYDAYPMLVIGAVTVILGLCGIASGFLKKDVNVKATGEYQGHMPVGPVFALHDKNTNLDLFCININNPNAPDYNPSLEAVENANEGIEIINATIPESLQVPDWVYHVYRIYGVSYLIDPGIEEQRNMPVHNGDQVCETANRVQMLTEMQK